MPATIEPYLVFAAILLILSVAVSKISDRFGIPALLLFLALGMLAGSDGPGGIYFDDPALAQSLGITALAIILFSGGLDTSWKSIRPVFKEGIVLATLGVLLTAVIAGGFAHLVLHTTLLEGILLGAIMSSTDAAAVFAILRSKGIHLSGRLKPLLELESGSNDPMAVFLTIGLTGLIVQPQQSIFQLVILFFQQMVLGVLFGVAAAKSTLYLINRLQLGYSGLYPVLTLGTVFLTFSTANLLGGSGFLAVYLAGLLMGRQEFLHKRSLLRFYDGLAWLMQIGMFLTLGLLVFPSRLGQVALPGLAIALFLLAVARPLAVMASLAWFRIRLPEKALVAWVGLRGAVPIILATYPRIMGLEQSDLIFNVVFFVVLTSVLLQGTTIPLVAERLGVKSEAPPKTSYPIEYVSETEWKGVLQETVIPPGSWAIGKPIYELGLPGNYLIVLISRNGDFIIPSGGIVLEAGDKMLGLSEPYIHSQVEQMFRRSSG